MRSETWKKPGQSNLDQGNPWNKRGMFKNQREVWCGCRSVIHTNEAAEAGRVQTIWGPDGL